MNRTIHLIRHGQSTFNAHFAQHRVDPLHFDARLTELGRQQVAAARETVARTRYELVVTSPLTRAIETTIGLFGGPAKSPVLVEALHRERLTDSCDVGRPRRLLREEFTDLAFDHLPEVWWHDEGERDPRGFAVEPEDVFLTRVAAFRSWLASRPERAIAVIGHGVFFKQLLGRQMANCEVAEWQP